MEVSPKKATPSDVLRTIAVSLAAASTFLAMVGIFIPGFQAHWASLLGYAAMAACLVLYGIMFLRQKLSSQRVTDSLAGMVSDGELKRLAADPARLRLAPTGRILTMMFIDVVGFSEAVERHSPEEAFTELRDLMTRLTATIHQHGGISDKPMGDGLLAFFGYTCDGSPAPADQADRAVLCALQIQRECLERSLQHGGSKDKIFHPLRIGINSAFVCVGDLAHSGRIDLTVLGHGVNFAKRLEAACESYGILLSAATHDMLTKPETRALPAVRRYLQLKHYNDLIETHEIDPFAHDPALREKAIKGYRSLVGLLRRDNRFPVPGETTVHVQSEYGEGKLQNFSLSGIGIRLDSYLARGVILNLHLESSPPGLRKRLVEQGVSPLVCEVRWGRPGDGGHVLGLAIKNLTPAQKETMLQELRSHVLPQAKVA